MRVNAAIQVAVDSLEFAEGQLKIVKNVHRLHGGSFQLLEKHFTRATTTSCSARSSSSAARFDSPTGSDCGPLSPRLVCDDMGDLRVEGGWGSTAARGGGEGGVRGRFRSWRRARGGGAVVTVGAAVAGEGGGVGARRGGAGASESAEEGGGAGGRVSEAEYGAWAHGAWSVFFCRRECEIRTNFCISRKTSEGTDACQTTTLFG